MKKIILISAFFAFACLSFSHLLEAHTVPDPSLVKAIAAIKVVDNHVHPLRALKEGEHDTEWGDLSYHSPETAVKDPAAQMPLVPFRLRPKSPEYVAIWQDIYGLSLETIKKDFPRELIRAKQKIMRDQAGNYPTWIMDKLGMETMLANRVIMDKSLPAPRFRWVPYADALMYPLSNEEARQTRPDLAGSYNSLERLLKTHLSDLGLNKLPFSLERYLATVVTPTLELQKNNGAVAVKFQTAYVRTLNISKPPKEQATRVYNRYIKGGKPGAAEYKALQDYLFRYICREAGRLNLVVHIHTGLGIGKYFDIANSNPMLLEPLFNDPALRRTNFVLLHGGWPFADQTAALLLKPNVYADFSSLGFLIYPHELSAVLRKWFGVAPDKVLFGTDGFELDRDMFFLNWEEFTYMGLNGARQALALTLTEMMQDKEITYDDALDIAGKVLRENAVRLYNLKTP